jgi:type III pantothenate kinase
VVPSATHEVRAMVSRYFHCQPVVVEPGVRTGVPILTDNPKEVGTDRIVNAVAAAHLYGGPCIIIDFSTAIIFDAVSAKGEYLGGALAPGVEVSVDALGRKGAQLRTVELGRPRSVIGRNTVEALQSGILYGYAGLVDGIVGRMVAELGGSAQVVATGSLAPMLLQESRFIAVHEPWLTLIGLRLIYEKNASA